jgi:hypothetical protein
MQMQMQKKEREKETSDKPTGGEKTNKREPYSFRSLRKQSSERLISDTRVFDTRGSSGDGLHDQDTTLDTRRDDRICHLS